MPPGRFCANLYPDRSGGINLDKGELRTAGTVNVRLLSQRARIYDDPAAVFRNPRHMRMTVNDHIGVIRFRREIKIQFGNRRIAPQRNQFHPHISEKRSVSMKQQQPQPPELKPADRRQSPPIRYIAISSDGVKRRDRFQIG